MTSPRVRLVGITVTPAVVLDDGEHLSVREVGSLNIPAARLDDVPELLRAALANLQAQINEREA